jgi:predicted acetyltransferase
MAEFMAEGRGAPGDDSMVGDEIREFGGRGRWSTAEGFGEYVRWLCAQALPESQRPAGHVPATTLWWVDGAEYLGRIAIRHRLTPQLLELYGHIGYDVRPTARRRGHATAMLAAALPAARRLGIDSALITCEHDNVGSRAVIERNGGALEDRRGTKLRFWVPTANRGAVASG